MTKRMVMEILAVGTQILEAVTAIVGLVAVVLELWCRKGRDEE